MAIGLPDPGYWRGRKVFITGHTGFKGGWLALWLRELEAIVTGFSLAADRAPNLCELAGIETVVRSVRGDIRDMPSLGMAMRAAEPEVVFHLAAQPLVQRSYADPRLTYETNVLGTVNVLEAIRSTPSVSVALAITTDKVYQNNEWVWAYRENDRLGGYDPYSSSKACSELAVDSWRQSYFQKAGIALASARAGNVIGGGDWSADRLVPDCIRAFQSGQPVSLRNPNATRPWQYVLEPLCGYLLLAERLHQDGKSYSTAWNFGPDLADIRPVSWIVDQMARDWGGGASWRGEDHDHHHEAGMLAVDASQARARLGWRPRLTLEDALSRTVRWYRRQAEGVPALDLVIEDLHHYRTR